MKQKLLVVGGDFGTRDLIKEARKEDVYVIAADWYETSATKELADEKWQISTADIEELSRKCREENVTAAVFGVSDFNGHQCRRLCKAMNFPVFCKNDSAWRAGTDKRYFKDLCKEVGAPVATDYYLSEALTEEELAQVQYPVVVKPVDECANRGMSYCSNREELIEGYKNALAVSGSKNIIVERQLKGQEFDINYVLCNGKMVLQYFLSEHQQPGEMKNLYSVISTTPYMLKKYLEEVNDKVMKVFEKAGCRNGVAWVEAILDQDGHFYLLEMGHRFDSAMPYVPFIENGGFNTVKLVLDCSLNEEPPACVLPALEDVVNRRDCGASYHLFSDCEGTVGNITGLEEISAMANVYPDLSRKVGDAVKYHSCMGVIRVYGRDCDEMCRKISEINEKLKITDTNGKNMIIYYDDFASIQKEYRLGIAQLTADTE